MGLYLLCSNVETIRFDKISGKDDLPENSVLSICQDHLGLLWLGTQRGLAKYDGYEMEVFYYSPDSLMNGQKEERLSINNNTVIEDPAGDLWMGNENRLFRFDRETERFILFSFGQEGSGTLSWSSRIRSLFIDADSTFWIGTQKDGHGAPGLHSIVWWNFVTP